VTSSMNLVNGLDVESQATAADLRHGWMHVLVEQKPQRGPPLPLQRCSEGQLFADALRGPRILSLQSSVDFRRVERVVTQRGAELRLGEPCRAFSSPLLQHLLCVKCTMYTIVSRRAAFCRSSQHARSTSADLAVKLGLRGLALCRGRWHIPGSDFAPRCGGEKRAATPLSFWPS